MSPQEILFKSHKIKSNKPSSEAALTSPTCLARSICHFFFSILHIENGNLLDAFRIIPLEPHDRGILIAGRTTCTWIRFSSFPVPTFKPEIFLF